MSTIKSSREIDRIFKAARRASNKLLVVLSEETPEGRGPQGRVAFVAGKRLGNAVVRNRNKRVLRETVRRVGGPWAGFDVVVIARPGTSSAAPQDLDRALGDLLARAGIVS